LENKLTNLQAVILAGGLGTRLKSEVPDLPKCMAPVAGKPFIDHVIQNLNSQGINKFVFAVGYMHEHIISHLNQHWPTLDFEYVIEAEPLGTGGAIGFATRKITGDHFLVLNGDTLFSIDYQKFYDLHILNNPFISVALKPMENFVRYGTVDVEKDGRIIAFNEKKASEKGSINGGVYLINTAKFRSFNLPKKYSFEKDILEYYVGREALFGIIFDNYFIDIGIPSDFHKADHDLRNH
jgi:D-glycero-alpha-D-manno-heptose 1-phosphate guanylyltransferase